MFLNVEIDADPALHRRTQFGYRQLTFEASLDNFRAYWEHYVLARHEFAFDISEFQLMDRGFTAANRIISSPMIQPTKLEHRRHLGGPAPSLLVVRIDVTLTLSC